jgi:glycosyl transferase, family 25
LGQDHIDTFVINLRQSTDRLAFMRSQLGGGFERVEAIQGDDVPAFLSGQFGAGLTAGEIGCYASHLLVASIILARELPYAVVLEDDAQIDLDAWDEVREAARHLADWDVIGLSGAKQDPHRRITLLEKRYLVRYSRFPKVTAAYVLSRSGSQKLLQPRLRSRPVDVDIRYGWEMGLKGYGIYPPPARPAGFETSIPRCGAQRFYWRTKPLGYVWGRACEFNAFLWMKAPKAG